MNPGGSKVKITKTMYTETAHRLNGHPGRCKFLHGHSYKWEVSLDGPVGEDGMLTDFSILKQVMMTVIDPFDHAIVLEGQLGESIESRIHSTLIAFGAEERVVVVPYRPTAENMSLDIAQKIAKLYPEFTVTVKLWETTTSFAECTVPVAQ